MGQAASQESVPSAGVLLGRAESLGTAMRDSLIAVLEDLPGASRSPSALAESLGLSRVIMSRLVNALECREPVEILHRLPGPESIRGFLGAASLRGLTDGVVERAQSTVDAFEMLIREVFGTRSALDAFLSANSPAARERFELSGRQAVFKGMSELLGARAETWLCSLVITPGAGGFERPDILAIHGALGVRQLRPDATVCFGYLGPAKADHERAAPAARRLAMGAADLEAFYLNPPAPLEIIDVGGVPTWVLRNAAPGRNALVDMLRVDVARSAKPGDGSEGSGNAGQDRSKPVRSLWALTDLPSNKLIFDVLLSPDLARLVTPVSRVYDTSIRGVARPEDRTRLIDVRTPSEPVEHLGMDHSGLDCDDVPRYSQMLAHACRSTGVDPSGYSVYRLRVQYPVYGWQFCMLFEDR